MVQERLARPIVQQTTSSPPLEVATKEVLDSSADLEEAADVECPAPKKRSWYAVSFVAEC